MFLRSGLLSSFAGLFIWVKNKRSCYVVVVGSHSRRFLSGICRFVREQSRQKQIPERCGPPHTREWPLIDNKTPGNSKNSPGVLLKGVALWSSSRSVFIRDLSFRKGTTTAKTDSRLRLSGMTTLWNKRSSWIYFRIYRLGSGCYLKSHTGRLAGAERSRICCFPFFE